MVLGVLTFREDLKKIGKENDIGNFSVRHSDIKSSDKNIWVLTPTYPTLIVTNENVSSNLKQI